MDDFWARWNGVCFIPARPELVERALRPDQHVLLEIHHERSHAKHRAFFASLAEAWASLRSDEFPTVEHLRKFALIRSGWYDERFIACDSPEMAARVAAFIRPMDEFHVVMVDGSVVRQWTAKSQSYKAMGRDAFNKSMDDVLGFVAGLLGVDRETLLAQGEMA
jgi:hypothetical protein